MGSLAKNGCISSAARALSSGDNDGDSEEGKDDEDKDILYNTNYQSGPAQQPDKMKYLLNIVYLHYATPSATGVYKILIAFIHKNEQQANLF